MLNGGDFVILRWGGQRFYADSSRWLRALAILHAQLLRFDPADLDGQQLAVVFSGSTAGRCGGGGRRGGLSFGGRGLRALALHLNPVHLDQVFVGRQLAGAGPRVVLADGVLAAAHCLLVGGYSKLPGLFLSPAHRHKKKMI